MTKVLIVDDNKLLRTLLTQILMEAGHDVVQAVDGNEAFAMIKVKKPDIVITDFYMPEMDGEALVKMIRSEPGMKTIPIIGLAGTADSEHRLKEAGVDEYLPKPLHDHQILSAVQRAIDSLKK
jgi:CheY-like chemotaxis protein